jgi:hypothetical protein
MKKVTTLLTILGLYSLLLVEKVHSQDAYNLLIDSTVNYSWDNNAQSWKRAQKSVYLYEGSLNKLSQISNYDLLGQLTGREIRTYTDSTMIRVVMVYKEGVWINSLRYMNLFEETNQVKYSESSKWTDDMWLLADKVYWTYDGIKLVKLTRQLELDEVFMDAQQTDYIYNENGFLSEYLITDLISQRPIRRILYSYNSSDQRMYGVIQSWNGDWTITGKILYMYNTCGELIEVTNQAYNGSSFVNTSKTKYFYSPHFLNPKTKKVPICHNGKTIYVSVNAVRAHLAHGDCIGECRENKIAGRRDKEGPHIEKKPPFSIFPNPAQEMFTIKFDSDGCAGQIRVELTDYFGRLLKTVSAAGKEEITIYRENLMAGKYYVRVIGEEVFSMVVIFK